MSEIKSLMEELKSTLRKVLVFDIFLETILVYLCTYIFLMIFNLFQKLAIIPAITYFVFMVIKRRKLTSIRTVENKYPILKEALTTAGDTIDEDNYVVNELRTFVKNKVRRVSASTFLDLKPDFIKIGTIVGLLFLILGLSICQGTNEMCAKAFSTIDIQKAVKNIDVDNIIDTFRRESLSEVDMGAYDVNDKYNINSQNALLKTNQVVKLGDTEVRINIKLANDQIDINDFSENVKEKEFEDSEINGIGTTGDANFEENIKKEHKDIVKNYFNTISR